MLKYTLEGNFLYMLKLRQVGSYSDHLVFGTSVATLCGRCLPLLRHQHDIMYYPPYKPVNIWY